MQRPHIPTLSITIPSDVLERLEAWRATQLDWRGRPIPRSHAIAMLLDKQLQRASAAEDSKSRRQKP